MLYNNVISVYGFKRVLLIDLQTSQYIFFDKVEFEKSQANNAHEINQILRNKKFVFPQEIEAQDHSFPKLKYLDPFSHYFNLIIDISKKQINDFPLINDFLLNINCNSLQLRFFEDIDDSSIIRILKFLSERNFLENLEIVVNSSCLTDALFENSRTLPIHHISTYGDTNNSIKHNLLKKHLDYNPFREIKIFFRFYFNQRFVMEAMDNNPYFYNKLYVDVNGDIYHTPEIKQVVLSNLYLLNIKQLKKEITNFINNSVNCIAKDKILICKDCELRFCCMDNRLVVKNGDYYMYENPCIYNPYIAKWAGEEGFFPIKECGTYSTETGFIPDIEKIAAINNFNQ
jgi:radical SAM protein with 4Fe4S-binding SPASM domain